MAIEQKLERATKKTSEADLRLRPLLMAAAACYIIGTSGGYAALYLLSSNSPSDADQQGSTATSAIFSSAAQLADIKAEASTTSSAAGKNLAPAGELQVESAEVALGGGETERPVQRVFVEDFAIGETEVTVAQFREFLEATKEQNNLSKRIKLPNDKDDYPVTNISWSEAAAYCKWLGEKINAEVRLPTEAEWELAARGKNHLKYSWGNEWNDDAAACRETKGEVQAVKSRPLNKSPFGAYDMVGNVWEWTAEVARDEFGKERTYAGSDPTLENNFLYIVKGGAALEPRKNISAQTWFQLARNFSSEYVGFRYVVIRR